MNSVCFFSTTVEQLVMENRKHHRLIDNMILTAVFPVGGRNLDNTFISFYSTLCVLQRTNHGKTE